MALPTFLVIGAQKCGTTSLHAYLALHPQIEMPAGVKELDFFLEGDHGSAARGVAWYSSHWEGTTPARGEVSPNYTAHPFHRGVPGRAAALVPEARLLYVVRDPVERIVSHYVHRRAQGLERRGLEDALADMHEPTCGYVQRSLYMRQLDRWLEHYGAGHVLVVASERLRTRRADTLDRIFAFLEVATGFRDAALEAEHHRAIERRELAAAGLALERAPAARLARDILPERLRRPLARRARRALSRAVPVPAVSVALRARLEEVLGPDAARLRDFTGDAFAEWSL